MRGSVVLAGLTVIVGVLAALAGCAGIINQGSGLAAQTPAYRVGDRWVYRGDDGFRQKTQWEETREVVVIGTDGITVRITQKGPSIDVTRTELWLSPGQVKIGAVCDNATECNYLIWYAPAVRGVVRAEMDAGFLEKEGSLDGGGVVNTQHGLLELVLFTPGRS